MEAMKIVKLFALVALVAMVACNPAKRQCRKAEGLLAKAVKKCPSLLKPVVQTDTVTVWLTGSAAAGEAHYSQARMDSVVVSCSAIVGALRRSTEDATDRADDAEARAQKAQAAIAQLRSAICEIEPVTVAEGDLLLKIWTENGKIRYVYHVLPRSAKAVVKTTSAQVAFNGNCPPCDGVASWYRIAFWILAALILLMTWLGFTFLNAPFDSEYGR